MGTQDPHCRTERYSPCPRSGAAPNYAGPRTNATECFGNPE
jgi:hypothetical protein